MVRGVVLVGLASLAVAGCESVYSAPHSGPTARVAVTRALLLETQQAKLLYRGADRSRRDWFGEGIFYEYDKTWPVAAETRTEFEVETLTYAGYTELYCSTFYSFTPKSGRSYSFAPVMPGRGCSVAILDKETGKAPSDLVQEIPPAE
ncbi:MAG: hypothetical protein ABMA14_20540 [Hyphomonadaceae bacterium]